MFCSTIMNQEQEINSDPWKLSSDTLMEKHALLSRGQWSFAVNFGQVWGYFSCWKCCRISSLFFFLENGVYWCVSLSCCSILHVQRWLFMVERYIYMLWIPPANICYSKHVLVDKTVSVMGKSFTDFLIHSSHTNC